MPNIQGVAMNGFFLEPLPLPDSSSTRECAVVMEAQRWVFQGSGLADRMDGNGRREGGERLKTGKRARGLLGNKHSVLMTWSLHQPPCILFSWNTSS